jgi:hypothetical protein
MNIVALCWSSRLARAAETSHDHSNIACLPRTQEGANRMNAHYGREFLAEQQSFAYLNYRFAPPRSRTHTFLALAS